MKSTPLRIVFAGTPEFAAQHLDALESSEHQIVAVYTQPDRPAGRGKKMQASPVKSMALNLDIPVYQPASLKALEAQTELAQLKADILIVVAYGLILPQAILDTPRYGCINVHASLLPRWRGAAPIQRAIGAGDKDSGITIMQMDAGLDTGNILSTAECKINSDTTAGDLLDTLADIGGPLLLSALADLPELQTNAHPQNNEMATYAEKILKTEAAIDWHLGALELDRTIRAFNPFPICFSLLDGQRVKIWEAHIESLTGTGQPPGTITMAQQKGICVQCGIGALCITQLQLPGGKPLTAAQLLNSRGDTFAVGSRFGPTTDIPST